MTLQQIKMLVCVLLTGLFAWKMYDWGDSNASARYELQISKQAQADAEQKVTVVEDNRKEEARRSEVVENVDVKAVEAQQVIAVAVIESNAVADRLSLELKKLRTKYASDKATCNVRVAQLSETGATALELLTELYEGAEGRARGFAETADRSRERGLACEAIYDGTRNKTVDVSN